MTRRNEPPKDLLDWLGLRQAPNWAVARTIGGLVSVILLLLFALSLTAAAALLLRTVGGGEGSFGAGALIVAILSAPFLIWNTVIRHRALEFQKEGHLTDRLAKAIEQLGAEKTVKNVVTDVNGNPMSREITKPNLEVRTGGLLSLERIAQDSTAYDKGRDHVRVMEIICAYIRNNAPADGAPQYVFRSIGEPVEGASEQEWAEYRSYQRTHFGPSGEYEKWLRKQPLPREDIRLALEILDRRSPKQRRIEAAYGQDEHMWEADWPFDPVKLDRSLVEEERLPSGSVFPSAKLRNYDDVQTRAMQNYKGYRLDLRRTCLRRASLQNYRFGGVRLTDALLEGADLSEARLEGALLKNLQDDRATYRDACIASGTIVGVDFHFADRRH